MDTKERELEGERPVCRLERVRLDLANVAARSELFHRMGKESRRVLILTEGLLMYLAPEEVRRLAEDLAAVPSFTWWGFDILSPFLLRRLRRTMGPALAAGGAELRFAPAEGAEFFRPLGWNVLEFRSSWEEGRRLKREMPLAWLVNGIARLLPSKSREAFHRLAGFVLLERHKRR